MAASSSKLKEPSILLASSNCQRLLKNVSHVLDAAAVGKLRQEIDRNIAELLQLGEEHLIFARGIAPRHWRQRISRLYYAALNFKRAITLDHSGEFSTDVSDHKNVGNLPDDFPSANTFGTRLENLRDDRNLADYSHVSTESDLILRPSDAEVLVVNFQTVAKKYLQDRGFPR